ALSLAGSAIPEILRQCLKSALSSSLRSCQLRLCQCLTSTTGNDRFLPLQCAAKSRKTVVLPDPTKGISMVERGTSSPKTNVSHLRERVNSMLIQCSVKATAFGDPIINSTDRLSSNLFTLLTPK